MALVLLCKSYNIKKLLILAFALDVDQYMKVSYMVSEIALGVFNFGGLWGYTDSGFFSKNISGVDLCWSSRASTHSSLVGLW